MTVQFSMQTVHCHGMNEIHKAMGPFKEFPTCMQLRNSQTYFRIYTDLDSCVLFISCARNLSKGIQTIVVQVENPAKMIHTILDRIGSSHVSDGTGR